MRSVPIAAIYPQYLKLPMRYQELIAISIVTKTLLVIVAYVQNQFAMSVTVEDDQHFSFTAGFKDLYYCKDCKTKQKEIEHNFIDTIIEQGLCLNIIILRLNLNV